eukprot:Skav233013  [mRNA]  locus=scaffold909:91090:97039:+ [translate_table: standard]
MKDSREEVKQKIREAQERVALQAAEEDSLLSKLKEKMGAAAASSSSRPKPRATSPSSSLSSRSTSPSGGDPETHVPSWVRNGAPLGIEEQIPTCGIFPPSRADSLDFQTDAELEDAGAQLMRGELLNYATVQEDKVNAKKELDRYRQAGLLRLAMEPDEPADSAAVHGNPVLRLVLAQTLANSNVGSVVASHAAQAPTLCSFIKQPDYPLVAVTPRAGEFGDIRDKETGSMEGAPVSRGRRLPMGGLKPKFPPSPPLTFMDGFMGTRVESERFPELDLPDSIVEEEEGEASTIKKSRRRRNEADLKGCEPKRKKGADIIDVEDDELSPPRTPPMSDRLQKKPPSSPWWKMFIPQGSPNTRFKLFPKLNFANTKANDLSSKASPQKAWTKRELFNDRSTTRSSTPAAVKRKASMSRALAMVKSQRTAKDLVTKVGYLGRWKSNVIMDYAQEALQSMAVNNSTAFTKNFNEEPQQCRTQPPKMVVVEASTQDKHADTEAVTVTQAVVKAIQKEVAAFKKGTKEGMDSLQADVSTLQAKIYLAANYIPCKVKSVKQGVIHRTHRTRSCTPAVTWKTLCGWHFHTADYLFVDDENTKETCSKCLNLAQSKEDEVARFQAATLSDMLHGLKRKDDTEKPTTQKVPPYMNGQPQSLNMSFLPPVQNSAPGQMPMPGVVTAKYGRECDSQIEEVLREK